jgi:hypothetical protein
MAYYRCYIFRDMGDWFAIADIVSNTDHDAARQAAELSDGRTFELRLHDRVIHPRTLSAPGETEAAAVTPLAALAG